MANDLNWTTNVNVLNPYDDTTPNGTAWQLWWLKEQLKTAGWTVVSSSITTSSGSGDLWCPGTFDETTSTFQDGTSLVNNKIRFTYNAGSEPHSWIILQAPSSSSPLNGYKLTLNYQGRSSNGLSIEVGKPPYSANPLIKNGYAVIEKFSGFYDNVLKTAVYPYTGSLAASASYQSFNRNRVNFGYTSEGYFYFMDAQQGKNQFGSFIGLLPLQNSKAQDEMPFELITLQNYSFPKDVGGEYIDISKAAIWYKPRYLRENSYPMGIYEGSKHIYSLHNRSISNGISKSYYNAVISPSVFVESLAATVNPNNYTSGPITQTASHLFIKDDETKNISDGIYPSYINTYVKGASLLDGTYIEMPALVFRYYFGLDVGSSETFNNIEFAGRLSDFSLGAQDIPDGAVTPSKTSPSDKYEKTMFDGVWVPWASTQAPIL